MAKTQRLQVIPPGALQVEYGVPLKDRTGNTKPKGPVRLALEALAEAPTGASVFIPRSIAKNFHNLHATLKASAGSGWAAVRAVDGGWRVWKTAEPKRPA